MDWNSETEQVVRDLFTEARCDALIEVLVTTVPLPWWARRIARIVLDRLTPEVLIEAMLTVLQKEAADG